MKMPFFYALLLLCFLGSCNKIESNQVDILISVAASNTEYTFSSKIGQLSFGMFSKDGENRSEFFSREVELSTTLLDTLVVNRKMFVGTDQISNLGVSLFGVTIGQDKEVIIETSDNFLQQFADFELEFPSEGGYIGSVLFELDLERSLTTNTDGEVIFDPVFTIKEL